MLSSSCKLPDDCNIEIARSIAGFVRKIQSQVLQSADLPLNSQPLVYSARNDGRFGGRNVAQGPYNSVNPEVPSVIHTAHLSPTSSQQ